MEPTQGNFFAQVVFVAITAAIAMEIVKWSVLDDTKEMRGYGTAINILTVALVYVLIWVGQSMGWIESGWGYWLYMGVYASGLAILAYEGVNNIVDWVTGRKKKGEEEEDGEA